MGQDDWLPHLSRWDPVEIVGVGRPWVDPLSAQRTWDQTPTAQILLRVLEEHRGAAALRPVVETLVRGLPPHERYASIRAKYLRQELLNLPELQEVMSWANVDDTTPEGWGCRCVLQAILGESLWRAAYYAERFIEGHNLSYVVRKTYPVEWFTR